MSSPIITQSLIKALDEYRNGNACGLQMAAAYHEGKEVTAPSDAMLLGQYVEYLATGALPKHGKTPEPGMTKAGKLTAPYERAEKAASLFTEIVNLHGITIIEAGKYVERDGCGGTIDILANMDGERCIIDVKYSGYLNSDFRRWSWRPDAVAENETYLLQAVHYSWLLDRLPFYFLVIDSSTGDDYRLMRVLLEPSHYAAHELMLAQVRDTLNRQPLTTLEPRPSRTKCGGCLIAESCFFATKSNPIETIYPYN